MRRPRGQRLPAAMRVNKAEEPIQYPDLKTALNALLDKLLLVTSAAMGVAEWAAAV